MPDADGLASNNPYRRENQDYWARVSAGQARHQGGDDDRTQAEAQGATGEELTEEERRWLAEEAAQQPTGEELTEEERRWLAEEAAQQPIEEELTEEARRIMEREVADYRARTGWPQLDSESFEQEPPPAYRTMAAPGEQLTDTQVAAMAAYPQYPWYAPQQGMTMPSAGDSAPWDSRTLDPNQARFAAEAAGMLHRPSAPARSPADWQRDQVGQWQGYARDTLLSPDRAASAADRQAIPPSYATDLSLWDESAHQDAVAVAEALGTVSFFPGDDVQQLLYHPDVFTISPSPSPSPPPVNPVARAANRSVQQFPSGRSASGSGTRRNPAGTPFSPVTAQGRQRGGPARGRGGRG
ncbi:hypothetical protein [Streptomyces fumanus]|uniref:hypothetical protein n=1 Tax=Streptomyces fumanus TaxID=67302 RepID=UPI0033DBFF9B